METYKHGVPSGTPNGVGNFCAHSDFTRMNKGEEVLRRSSVSSLVNLLESLEGLPSLLLYTEKLLVTVNYGK